MIKKNQVMLSFVLFLIILMIFKPIFNYGNIKLQEINENDDFTPDLYFKTKEIFGKSSEGGIIKTIYFENEVVYANVLYYGEMGKSEREYNFYDSFIMIKESILSYSEPFITEPSITIRNEYIHFNSIIFEINQETGDLTIVDEKTKEKFEDDINEIFQN